MILIGGLFLGLGWSLLVWSLSGPLLAHESLRRRNYRGASVPTAGGVVLVVAVVGSVSFLVAGAAAGIDLSALTLRSGESTVAAVTGFGLLGLFDDILGVGTESGYRGHLSALLRGRLTSGAVKMFGGALLALVLVAPVAGDSFVQLVVDGALLALAANLANLLDRAPGRTIKVGVVAFVVLAVVVGVEPGLAGAAITTGAALGLLVPDLREQIMIGDTGANALGAALGLAAVLTLGETARVGLLVALLLLNLASEFVSYSATIDRWGPLRVLDRLGRRPDGAGPR